MHVQVNRESLVEILAKVGGVVEKRQTLPILGNFFVSAAKNAVEMMGTDLEIEIRTKTGAIVQGSGETTLPARKIMDICRALPEQVDVSIRVEKDRALIEAGRSRFSLSTLPAKDFPIMEWNIGMERIELDSGVLKKLLEKTAFAMAHQDVRYYLNGLLLEVRADGIVAVATDGHRLAKVEEKLPLGIAKEIQVILPRKTVLEINRLLKTDEKRDTAVRIEISEKAFRCVIEDTVITSKLIDGRYPDYERVIPPNPERIVYANREVLKQALLRTSILSNEKYRGVRFSVREGQLRLQASNPEQEEAEEELEVVYTQQPTVVGFNVGYLVDVLNVLDEDEVEISIKDSESSAILRNRERGDETFVVMPMRL